MRSLSDDDMNDSLLPEEDFDPYNPVNKPALLTSSNDDLKHYSNAILNNSLFVLAQ